MLLEGSGVAAVCVAQLLSDANIPVFHMPHEQQKPAYILLGDQTQALLRSIFEGLKGADIFDGFPRITRRLVQWGPDAFGSDLPHSGIVVSERVLLDRLAPWRSVSEVAVSDSSYAVRINTRRADHGVPLQFGSREARFAQVRLALSAEPDACWIESLEHGWLFLLSVGNGEGSLIAVGGEPEDLLRTSRLVAPRVAEVVRKSPPVPCHPRLSLPVAIGNEILCGSAAMQFDPLCGEGAGNAVREAFLAAAIVRAVLAGEDIESLTQHYSSRLLPGFLRHLQVCRQFYATGGNGPFWRSETEALNKGIEMMTAEIAKLPPARFRLVDRTLIPI